MAGRGRGGDPEGVTLGVERVSGEIGLLGGDHGRELGGLNVGGGGTSDEALHRGGEVLLGPLGGGAPSGVANHAAECAKAFTRPALAARRGIFQRASGSPAPSVGRRTSVQSVPSMRLRQVSQRVPSEHCPTKFRPRFRRAPSGTRRRRPSARGREMIAR